MQNALGTQYIQLLQKFRSEVNNNHLRKAYHRMIIRQKTVERKLGKLKPGNRSDEKKASDLACDLVNYKADQINKFIAMKKSRKATKAIRAIHAWAFRSNKNCNFYCKLLKIYCMHLFSLYQKFKPQQTYLTKSIKYIYTANIFKYISSLKNLTPSSFFYTQK